MDFISDWSRYKSKFEVQYMEAEGEKLSEEVHKQCKDEATNYCTREDMEQCRDVFMEAKVASYLPDEETNSEGIPSEEITSEEFHGESNKFTEKELE